MTSTAGDIERAQPGTKKVIASNLRGCLLQVRFFFRQNCAFYRANLQTNAAVNAGIKVNPIPACALLIFTWAFINAGYWASIYAVCDAFAYVGDNSVGHRFFLFETNVLIKLS